MGDVGSGQDTYIIYRREHKFGVTKRYHNNSAKHLKLCVNLQNIQPWGPSFEETLVWHREYLQSFLNLCGCPSQTNQWARMF